MKNLVSSGFWFFFENYRVAWISFGSMAADEVRLRVSMRIREIAERRGLNVPRLAERAGTSRPYLYAVLNGEKAPTIDWLARVAEALRVDVHELLKPVRKGKK